MPFVSKWADAWRILETSSIFMNPDDSKTRKKFRSLRDLLLKEAESKYSDSEKHLEIVRTAARKTSEERQNDQSADDGIKFKCPECEEWFAREHMMYISPNLLGDPILGADAKFRFHPTQFDDNGRALDANGNPCADIACPNCRKKLPDAWSARERMQRLLPKLNKSGEITHSEKKRK